MGGWLLASVFLLLSSLWAHTFGSIVGAWLAYLLLSRKRLASELPRTGGLQVIVCGFPRTGTLSLTEALGILGFRCLHGMHLSHPTTAKRFMKAYEHDNPKDWEKLFQGFTAVSDFPATCSYRQLSRVYPNAKIILNIRDANKWYNSFSNTMVRLKHGEQHMVFKIFRTNVGKCVDKSLFKQFFDEKPENREICVTALLQHIQDVQKHVPPEKLLIYDFEKEEDWPHLCRFLNVPVPEVPFPHIHATSEFNAIMKRIGNVYMMVFGVYVVLVACAFVYII